MAKFLIDGKDLLPYIAQDGIDWGREDLDASGSGRSNLTGYMYRSRVASKTKVEITFKDGMTLSDVRTVQNMLYPEYVILETDMHPRTGEFKAEMYSNAIKVKTSYICDDGTVLFDAFTAPLIER